MFGMYDFPFSQKKTCYGFHLLVNLPVSLKHSTKEAQTSDFTKNVINTCTNCFLNFLEHKCI